MSIMKEIRIQLQDDIGIVIRANHINSFFLHEGDHFIMENKDTRNYEDYNGIQEMHCDLAGACNKEQSFQRETKKVFEKLKYSYIVGVQLVFTDNSYRNYTTRNCDIRVSEYGDYLSIKVWNRNRK